MAVLLAADQLLTPKDRIHHPMVLIEDGVIVWIKQREEVDALPKGELHNFPGATLVPAFFDVHTHGAAGHDVMEADSGALDAISRFLAGRGVGSYLATTVTAPLNQTLKALDGLAARIESGDPGARMVGIHLEGPFLSHGKRGVHPPASLQEPSIAIFDCFWQEARGQIRLMTIAPELPGAPELIAYASSLGVHCSMGHSNADSRQTRQAIAAGACSATHTFNAMRPLDHRDAGILGAVLSTDELYAEIICDGVHVDPAIVKLFWRAKGAERCVLVTDAMSATGMPDGTYMLGGLHVEVAEGKCMHEGVLAGSVLTMDRALRNMAAFSGIPLSAALKAATVNPARMAGFDQQIGALCVGRRADIAVLSPSGEVVATLLDGRMAGE